MKKNCINCHYFDIDGRHAYGGWICGLHTIRDNQVRITHPSQQFCGHDYWISNKNKIREKKLEDLGIND